MSGYTAKLREHATALLGAVGHLSGKLALIVEDGAARATATYRAELRRVVHVMALALVAAFFVCAAAGFATFSIMVAFWDTHPALVSALLATTLALLALSAVALIGRYTRGRPATD